MTLFKNYFLNCKKEKYLASYHTKIKKNVFSFQQIMANDKHFYTEKKYDVKKCAPPPRF